MSVPSQAKQVGTSTGRDGHGAVGVIPNQAGVPGHGGEEVQAEQPVQLVGRGAVDRDMHVDMDREVDHQLMGRMMTMLWQSLVWAEISVSRR